MLKLKAVNFTVNDIKVVSFDVEGTLTTTDFSYAIWFEMIPRRYAEKHGLGFDEAMREVRKAYDSVGDQRLEWYDVQYWFTRFGLGQADIAMQELQPRVKYFSDTVEVLEKLDGKYRLSVASGSPRPFLKHLLLDIQGHFEGVFSSTSDFKQVKTADFFRRACEKLGIEPSQMAHVGDNYQFDYLEPSSIGIHAFYLDRNGKSTDPKALRDLTEFQSLLIK